MLGATCLVAALAPLGPAGAETAVSPNVVNGVVGDPAEFPFLVALADRAAFERSGLFEAHICGGTVVAPRVVVTAAHCVTSRGTPLRPGSLIVARPSSGRLDDANVTAVRVSIITINPEYDDLTDAGDIAVLRLAEPLPGAVPVLAALPSEDALLTAAGQRVRVAGWGATRPTGTNFPEQFRVGDLIAFPRSACGGGRDYRVDSVVFRGWGREEVDPDTMICAEGVRDGAPVDSCIGDSGGPLIAGEGSARRLVGVVSWGPQRCASSFPGVYARIGAFTSFLRDHGVPFAVPGPDDPRAPRIIDTVVGPTRAIVTLQPPETGPAPQSYRVTAHEGNQVAATCTAVAPTDSATASCTLEGLVTATRYTVRAISIVDNISSESSPAVVIRPADRPLRPIIRFARAIEGGSAVFGVDPVNGNGAALTVRTVSCRANGQPTRTGPIERRGISTVTGLTPGVAYECRASLANALGSRRSAPVILRAR